MTWNYRVMKYEQDNGIGIHEVYYDEAGEPETWTQEPSVVGDSIEELRSELAHMLRALDESPIDYRGIPLSEASELAAEILRLRKTLEHIAKCNGGEGYMPELAAKTLSTPIDGG